MAKVYVELDIQAGLPEVLEIDWHNQLISQHLDYLGIPFRCSFCHRTGHLRRDCHKFPPPDIVLDPAEEPNFDGYISSPNLLNEEETPIDGRDSNPSDDSLIGKIHHLCPSLFNTFSSWDKLFIAKQEEKILGIEAKALSPDQSDPTSLSHTAEPAPSGSAFLPRPAPSSQPLHSAPSTLEPVPPPTIAITNTPEPFTLPGYTEPSQSDIQLESLFPTITTAHSLPFDSIPLHTYLGNSIIQPNIPPSNHPSSSNIPTTSKPNPHWSRGIGLEISPLKTRSARKKKMSGLEALENYATITNQGALRDFKALARGNS
jgi:hypothetical protein